MAEKEKFPTYKGKPLVRCGDVLYYGNMDERYVIRLQIKSKKTVNDLEVADKVTVQLMCTDPDISPRKQVVKASEKNGLYLAMDIGEIWLNRRLPQTNKNNRRIVPGMVSCRGLFMLNYTKNIANAKNSLFFIIIRL